MTVVERNVTVRHEKGLHARPASVFVRTASEFQANIRISKVGSDETADAKSSLGVMSLGVEGNDEITIYSEGPDNDEAVETLVKLVEDDFRQGDEE